MSAGTPRTAPEGALVVSIDSASAWQRTSGHADLSTPARALSLTGACDPTMRQQTTARQAHAHAAKELEPMQPLAPMLPRLGRDDMTVPHALSLAEKLPAAAGVTGEEDRLAKNAGVVAHGRFEQHCPLPPHPGGPGSRLGGAGPSLPVMHHAPLVSSSSAHTLGFIPRPSPPTRFFSVPLGSSKAQAAQRADTPRPVAFPATASVSDVNEDSASTASSGVTSVPTATAATAPAVESAPPPLLMPLPTTTSSVASTPSKHSTTTTTSSTGSATTTQLIPHHNLSVFLHETNLGSNMMLTRLQNGGILLKYGARGSPHYRLVRCDPSFREVQWSEIKGSHKVRGSVTTDSIRTVERGHHTKIFRDRALKSSVPNHCFSLVTTTRTLDLECCSSNECDMMVLAFRFLLERRDRLAHESTAECSDSEPSRSTSDHLQPRRRRSISVVSALDVLCDHSKVLSEPNSPNNNMMALMATGEGGGPGNINDLPYDSLILPPGNASSTSHSQSLTPARMQLAVSQVAHSLDLTLKEGVSQETENELIAAIKIEDECDKVQSDADAAAGVTIHTGVNPAAAADATVERLPDAPESFPEDAGSFQSTTPLQMQREFSKFAQLNQQPLLQQQQQQQQPPRGVGASTTSVAASSSTTAVARVSAYSHTPFVIDPQHFHQQDIFDLSTFAHLAAQSAADHGRTPFHPDAFTSAAASTASDCGSGSEFHRMSSAAADDAEFQSHMRRLHDEEVASCVASDPRLSLLQKQLDAYRSDRIKLEQSFAIKIGLLETEIIDLNRHNRQLRRLQAKMQEVEREVAASIAAAAAAAPSAAAWLPLPPLTLPIVAAVSGVDDSHDSHEGERSSFASAAAAAPAAPATFSSHTTPNLPSAADEH